MEISEVRIKLVEESGERLRAFCSITLDGDFVIRDLKIIDGVSGPFVAMPSRKLADRCPRCGCKNHLRAKFCNDCGLKLNENRAPKDAMGRAKLHADVAHPINAGCRERIQTAVIKAYEAEVEKSKSPDYRPPAYDDFGDDDVGHLVEEEPARAPAASVSRSVPPSAPPEDLGEEPVADTEPAVAAQDRDEEGHFGDYNSLIADLKREAAGRQGRAESTYAQAPRPTPAPARSERGGREGNRGDNRGGRNDRQRRDDRGPRGFDRRDDRRGGPPRDDRRRDQPRRSEATAESASSGPAPVKPQPVAAPPPPPPAAEDDFGAGL